MSKARDLANASTALSAVSATELAFLDGVTSAVQTQIDSKIAQATAINPTLVDAKGDIIAATAADTVARLAVGATNGMLLTVDSAEATGLKYALPAGGGKVLQVVEGTLQANHTSSITTRADIGLSVAITPSSATSKVMIIANLPYNALTRSGAATDVGGAYVLMKDSTDIQEIRIGFENFASSSNKVFNAAASFSILQSPATTSSITYKVQSRNTTSGTTFLSGASSTIIFSIVAMEIGA